MPMQKKSPRLAQELPFLRLYNLFAFLLLEELLVLAVELVNATGAVDELHLTRVEGVRTFVLMVERDRKVTSFDISLKTTSL